MNKQWAAVCCFLFLPWGTVPAGEDKRATIDNFLSHYHRKPAPDRVPYMLDLVLKEKLCETPIFARQGLLGQAFGYVARGNPKLIRLYESRVAGATEQGQIFLLTALIVCGDATTRQQIDLWLTDPLYAGQKDGLEAMRDYLADPKRQLPRDRPVQTPNQLASLWADFLTTGEYSPIARILDTLDRPEELRKRIVDRLKKYPEEQQDLLNILSTLQLLEPGMKDKLIAGDLEFLVLHDLKGRFKPGAIQVAASLDSKLGLSEEEIECGLLLKGLASWSLQNNLSQHPRLMELLKEHYHERPFRSRELIKKWLQIDQPKFVLDKEAQRFQGTWDLVKWEEDGDADTNPKLRAEINKYVRWTFAENELSTTKAFTFGNTVRGQGGTVLSTYTLEPTANPKILIVKTVGYEDDCAEHRAIYKFEGQVLQVCLSKTDKIPTEFTARPSSGCILLTLKKASER